MAERKVLAVDFGASGGRVMLGKYDGSAISIEEIHRFSNDPVILNGTMYWDFLRLFYEIKQGLIKAKAYGQIDSIGVDTWGVDFGLVDREGNLVQHPVHYRDKRTVGILDQVFQVCPADQLYEHTGNQIMEINTAFQLFALCRQKSDTVKQADKMLLMPDLFNFYLSGAVYSELSMASTTQLCNPYSKTWDREIVEALGIPLDILADIIQPGTVLGDIRPEICRELGIRTMKVIAVAGHDTQSALAAVPAQTEDFIFISCGTWSLFGTELAVPMINEVSARLNVTNEIGVDGKISFLKNIIGLWLIQESRRQWIREGREYSFSQLEEMAAAARPLQICIDPNAEEFLPAGDIPQRIREYAKRTGQPEPETVGAIVRCINESLAFTYRRALEEISECTGKEYRALHIVGGGTKSGMLCQMTANACNLSVIAGPVEATVLGNIGIQLMALGEIRDLGEMRRTVSGSATTVTYQPMDTAAWDEAYTRYKAIISGML